MVSIETYFWATWINTLPLSQMFTQTKRPHCIIAVIPTESCFSYLICTNAVNRSSTTLPLRYIYGMVHEVLYVAGLFKEAQLLAFRLAFAMTIHQI